MSILFSDVFRLLRAKRGVTQEKIADAFGISVQAVSKWECGLSCPDISLLPDIAEYFGVSIDYLLTGSPFNPPNNNTFTGKESKEK